MDKRRKGGEGGGGCREAVEERSDKIERVWRRSVTAESQERQYVW